MSYLLFAVEYANERVPVIAGTGANTLHEAIWCFFPSPKGEKTIIPYYER